MNMSRCQLERRIAVLERSLQAVFWISVAALASAAYLDTASRGWKAAFNLVCAMCAVASVLALLIASAQVRWA